jgi:prepilin-type N-terminal cleavage/methylation domain-containing protein
MGGAHSSALTPSPARRAPMNDQKRAAPTGGDALPVPKRLPVANGFTLIEVLVALVITSALLAIIVNGSIVARDRAKSAENKRMAVQLAQSLYTERAAAPMSSAPASGTERRLVWGVTESARSSDPRGFFALVDIEVRLKDGQGRLLYRLAGRTVKAVGSTP